MPRPRFVSRPKLAIAIHKLTIIFVFLLIVLISQRPFFAGLVALGTLVVLVVVSNAKYMTLREPLVFSDIAMFSQAFKHPRLYLPFLGIIPAFAVPLLAITFIALIIKYEPALALPSWQWGAVFIFAVATFLVIKKLALSLKFSLQTIEDIKKYGLLSSLLGYHFQAKTLLHQQTIKSVLSSSELSALPEKNKKQKANKPNIITIQSESFFDARRLSASIKPSILENFDSFCEESLIHGSLNVPAWGANTMRTEFSFLTGIQSEELGFYQFYPYQYLADQNIPSLARYFSEQGYYCVCIHPHPASFFSRDRIFPKMGFDEFIDIESFEGKQTFGPYLSDKAVTEKILATINDDHEKPVFIFAITMENHGPLHLEKTDEEDVRNHYDELPLDNHNDLTVYLRHLQNADQMLGDLRDSLGNTDEESIICFYGDHIPSMPKVYETLDYENEHTDFFIWKNKVSNSHRANINRTHSNAESLAKLIVEITSQAG